MTAQQGLDFVASRFLDVVRDRDALRAEVEQLRAEVARVRSLHTQSPVKTYNGWCSYCRESWPCQTIAALNGALS